MKIKPANKSVFSVLRRKFMTWLIQHAQAFIFSMGQICKQPAGSLLTTTVIGISLALPAGFYLLLDNAQRITSSWDNAVQITLFLKLDIDNATAAALVDKLIQNEHIEDIKYIARDEALKEYQENSGFSDALNVLEENPLPAVLLVYPDFSSISPGEGEKLLEFLRTLPEVDTAQFDRQWVNRLFAIIDILQRVVALMASLLSIAVMLIVGNTIRLAIFNRRNEIEINKLCGATDAFIRRPFLYSGLILGIAGSMMSWLLLQLSVALLDRPISHLAGIYHSSYVLKSLNAGESLILILVGGCLGIIGSWLAVQYHLRDIEPI